MSARDTQYVRGAEKLARRIQTIRTALALPPMVDAIGALLLRRTLERFDRQVDPNEKKWKPLSEGTLRRREFKGAPILVQTKSLRSAIRVLRGTGEGAIYTNTGAGIRIGVSDESEVDKARTHQRGSKHVPARKFLGIGRNDVTAVDGLLRRASNKAGF